LIGYSVSSGKKKAVDVLMSIRILVYPDLSIWQVSCKPSL